MSLLVQVQRELEQTAPADSSLPGQLHRCRINAAYLLFESLQGESTGRQDGSPDPGSAPHDPPSPEELRGIICRLDPASAFAEKVFLAAPHPYDEQA